MRLDVSVKDVMTGEYLGVNESDPIRDAAELLIAEDASVVAVVRGTELHGMVNVRQFLISFLEDRFDPSSPIESAMMAKPPTIAHDADLAEAVTVLADANTDHLFVMDGDEIAGVLSENDALMAVTSMVTTGDAEQDPESIDPTGEVDELEETADLSLQSVCEVCGILKSDLANFNGQLICMDCRSV